MFQTLRRSEFEVIVVNDCSDKSYSVSLMELHSKIPGFRVVEAARNLGLSGARGVGVRESVGDFILFLDADDVLATDTLELLLLEQLQSGADVVSGHMVRVFWRDSYTHAATSYNRDISNHYLFRLKQYLSTNYSTSMCGRLFSKKVFGENAKIFFHERVYHEDIITFSIIIFDRRVSFSSVKKVCYYYSASGDSITSTLTSGHLKSYGVVFGHLLDLCEKCDFPETLLHFRRSGFSNYFKHFLNRVIYSQANESNKNPELLAEFNEVVQTLEEKGASFNQDFYERLNEAISLNGSSELEKVNSGKFSYESIGIRKEFSSSSFLNQRSTSKHVIVCEVDYHVRNAICLVKELISDNFCLSDFLIIDNSKINVGGKRSFLRSELPNSFKEIFHENLEREFPLDSFIGAKTLLVFNDYNDISRMAIHFRRFNGKSTFSVVEGISDFSRVDFDLGRTLPYRNSEIVFVSGEYDTGYFPDRETAFLTNYKVQNLISEKVSFPKRFTVLVNVNFSYGVLVTKRMNYWNEFIEAQKKMGFDYLVTKHPADTSSDKVVPRSQLAQNDLIKKSSVFVSRFATGILEALNLGKPVIYFNPHGEKVDKFDNPMGAFQIARNANELINCLNIVRDKISAGADFRSESENFLKFHLTGKNQLPEHLIYSEKRFEIEYLKLFLVRNEIRFKIVSIDQISLLGSDNLVLKAIEEINKSSNNQKFSNNYLYMTNENNILTFSASCKCSVNDSKVSLGQIIVYLSKYFLVGNTVPWKKNRRSSLNGRLYTLSLLKYTVRKLILTSIYVLRSMGLERKFLRFMKKELNKLQARY